jgi:hypothetical protein
MVEPGGHNCRRPTTWARLNPKPLTWGYTYTAPCRSAIPRHIRRSAYDHDVSEGAHRNAAPGFCPSSLLWMDSAVGSVVVARDEPTADEPTLRRSAGLPCGRTAPVRRHAARCRRSRR